MPPVKAYQIPDWANPQNASVLDNWWTRTARTIGQFMGMTDPASQVMGLAAAPIDVPAADAAGAVKQTLKAYHGSPHDFERFDSSKIGTGEGAQAYGHGLYFAENPAVAGAYRTLGKRATAPTPEVIDALKSVDYLGFDTPGQALTAIEQHPDWASRWDVSHPSDAAARDTIQKWVDANPRGRAYEVNIHASPDELLDWDKPLSQQPQKVQEALKKIQIPRGYMGSQRFDGQAAAQSAAEKMGLAPGEYRLQQVEGEPRWWQVMARLKANTGEDMYQQIVSAAGGRVGHTEGVASQQLKDAGIKGIQYLDQGSRAAGEGTRNFVIFDDKIIDIARKYGLSLPAAAEVYRAQQRTKPQPAQTGVE